MSSVAAAWLWSVGALTPYWDEVWKWGRIYAGAPFAESPLWNGLTRTLNWLGFHSALVVAGAAGIRQTGETLVYGREDGEPKLPGSLTGEFACLTRRMKDLPPVRFHDLRHSHATQLLADGVHPKIAQERLGHSSITTTMDLYSHVTDTMQADAAARLDAAFRPAITSRVAK